MMGGIAKRLDRSQATLGAPTILSQDTWGVGEDQGIHPLGPMTVGATESPGMISLTVGATISPVMISPSLVVIILLLGLLLGLTLVLSLFLIRGTRTTIKHQIPAIDPIRTRIGVGKHPVMIHSSNYASIRASKVAGTETLIGLRAHPGPLATSRNP